MSLTSYEYEATIICHLSVVHDTMAVALLRYAVLLCLLIVPMKTVDRNNFKTCEQSSFCRRLRKVPPNESKYKLNLDTLLVAEHTVEAELINTAVNVSFRLTLTSLANSTFRLFVDELRPLFPRYRVEASLDGEPQVSLLELTDRSHTEVAIKSGEDNSVILFAEPFKVEFYKKEALVAVVNGRGLFSFEHYRTKQPESENADETALKEDPGAWEENFKSHHDSKPRGPEAIGFDITFPGAKRAYGLPEHADKLALRTTGPGGLDPYRLYNLDVFEYELNSPMAIYGAIPVLYAHSPKSTVGVFWNNAAEMWVDVSNSKDANVVSSIVNLVSGQSTESNVDTHFMSESGVVDLFVFLGPTPRDAVRQYAIITGTAPLPQFFTLAYHQCRWNYNTEDDVTSVVEQFDEHDMPVDVMWLDIEYTDGKKYFTWDPVKFAHPELMQQNLTGTGRKLVVIIDPHIKRESGYFLHEDALANDYYVKNKDGNVYEGWCWPGSSSYLDFFNPTVRDYYAGLYALDKFKGSTNDMNIWNDMNEPSVFNGPEITMPKDVVHFGGWEHRHVHNIYGLLHTMATFDGLLKRTPNRRPFILTRGHFAGSQRVTAMWTGDNMAEWSHLAASLPMCLSEALGGISFCGADIGGFFHNPDEELLQRWYQAGVWLPFFRAHAHIDTRRREPYLFNEDVRTRIRNALRLRYSFLPLWYTLFWEHSLTGDPVIRPLFYAYPEDENVLDIEDQVLVGDSILVRPVTEAGVSTVSVYLPGGYSARWYDLEDYRQYSGMGSVSISVSLDKVPAFYRGGTIVARKNRPRRSSSLMHDDPYTLYVALDNNYTANGTLYIDDGETYEYKNKNYVYVQYEFKHAILTSRLIHDTKYNTQAWIERVVLMGAPKGLTKALVLSRNFNNVPVDVIYDEMHQSLVIRKPSVNVKEPFSIRLV